MYRPITITAVLNGFMATVGCQTVVFQTVDSLLAELGAYLRNPEETEKRYQSMPNARHTMRVDAPPPTVNAVDPRVHQMQRELLQTREQEYVATQAASTSIPRY